MIFNAPENQFHSEEETSILLNNQLPPKSEENEDALLPEQEPAPPKYLSRYFLLELFAWANYLTAILNLLADSVLYLGLYEPPPYRRFAAECGSQLAMSFLLDAFLSVATILFFSYVLRYLRQVA